MKNLPNNEVIVLIRVSGGTKRRLRGEIVREDEKTITIKIGDEEIVVSRKEIKKE